jgi:hypothetical protein
MGLFSFRHLRAWNGTVSWVMEYGDGMAFQFLRRAVRCLLSYKQEVGKESGRYVATYHVWLFRQKEISCVLPGYFEHCIVKLVDV